MTARSRRRGRRRGRCPGSGRSLDEAASRSRHAAPPDCRDAASTTSPLVDITDPAIGRTFPTRPDPADRLNKTVANPNDGDNTAYGLALWRGRANDKLYALVAQNNEVVVHQQTGVLYAGQEDVGIWRVNLKTRVAEPAPFIVTTAFDPTSPIARDVEGLTIYYAAGGKGYLIASSQGQSHGEAPTLVTAGRDDTFAVFARDGNNAHLGSFSLPKNTALGIDGVQDCDGADVTNVALPGFPGGLLITQDGYNDDLDGLDGEEAATNLKFTPWADVAANFPGGKLLVDTSYDPRNP